MTEYVPVHLVAYEDSAELDIDKSGENPSVENHDELVNNDETFDEIRAVTRETAEKYNMDIVTPDSPLWREEFADFEAGDSVRLDA